MRFRGIVKAAALPVSIHRPLTRTSPLQGMAVDHDLGITIKQHGERLVGKHVRPQVGMFVSMSGQGLERRKETGRADPSRAGVGEIMRVNENWTAGDVSLIGIAAALVRYRCMNQDFCTSRSLAFLGFQSGIRERNLVDRFLIFSVFGLYDDVL